MEGMSGVLLCFFVNKTQPGVKSDILAIKAVVFVCFLLLLFFFSSSIWHCAFCFFFFFFVCMHMCVCVCFGAKKKDVCAFGGEGGAGRGWRIATEDALQKREEEEKRCSQKSNDSLPKIDLSFYK